MIIPVYNVESFIRKCIDSVVNQTYKHLEIILVDDGSTDNSGAICDEYAARDARIVVVHQDNMGVGTARNKGLAIFKGAYLTFVDADDYVLKDYIEVLYRKICQYEADVSACCCTIVDLQGHANIRRLPQDSVFYSNNLDCLWLLETDQTLVTVWAKLYKATLFKQVKFEENVRCAEDNLLWMRLFLYLRTLVVINQSQYIHILRPNSLMSYDKFSDNVFEHHRVITLLKKEIETLYPQLSSFGEFLYWQSCFYVILGIYKYHQEDVYVTKINEIEKQLHSQWHQIYANPAFSTKCRLKFILAMVSPCILYRANQLYICVKASKYRLLNFAIRENSILLVRMAKEWLHKHVVQTLSHKLPYTLRNKLIALYYIGYWPNLQHPQTYVEKLLAYMRSDRLEQYARYVDKLAVRKYVADQVGVKYLTKVYGTYAHYAGIDFSKLPDEFYLKLNHGCHWNLPCTDKAKFIEDGEKNRNFLEQHLQENYAQKCGERQYAKIHPQIYAEELLELKETTGNIYRIYAFGGIPKFIQVSGNLPSKNNFVPSTFNNFYDCAWNLQPFVIGAFGDVQYDVSEPENLAEMLVVAQKLAMPFPFVRVDLYNIDGRIVFSELTFTPNSAHAPVVPKEWDSKLGNLWPTMNFIKDSV